MLKRLGVVGAIIGVLGLSFSIISPASSDSRFEKKTIHLVSKQAEDDEFITRIDVGEKGVSVGDYGVVGGQPLYNPSLKKAVAEQRGTFVYLEVDEKGDLVATEDDLTIEFRNGTLTAEGTDDFSKTVITFAVTGGTGAYETAHGELDIDYTDSELPEWTFRLLL
jgi:hypothetical protein